MHNCFIEFWGLITYENASCCNLVFSPMKTKQKSCELKVGSDKSIVRHSLRTHLLTFFFISRTFFCLLVCVIILSPMLKKHSGSNWSAPQMCELHVRSCEVQNFFPAEPILLGSDNSVNFLESGGESKLHSGWNWP